MTDDPTIVASMADIEAIEKIPFEQRVAIDNTYDLIKASAERHGERTAITFLTAGDADEDPVVLTYVDLLARVNQTANLFHDLGIRPGAVVSFILPNLPQTHFVIWGGEAAGIVGAVNPLLEPAQIADILRATETRVLVTLGPSAENDIWRKVDAIRAEVPSLETVLCIGGDGALPEGILDFDAEITKHPTDRLVSGRVIKRDDIASLFHTGGTTGAPKVARHTHWGEVYEAWAISLGGNLNADDVLICGLPLFHVNAVVVTGLAPFFIGASALIASPAGYRNPSVIENFWRIVERYRATFFSAVPTIYSTLLSIPMDGADVSSLRYAICGAAPMPVEVIRSFESQTGIKILEGYGLTEGTTASSMNPAGGERRTGSIGIRYPYQMMTTIAVDADGKWLRECEVDEIGVVVINGPNVFPGYLQDRHNEGIWPREGWFNTGDLARRDADGYFWLTGRAKDLIIRGGHNIDPEMIEAALHQHEAVALAAAVGGLDARVGEIPMAYVELKPGAEVTPDELMAHARAAITERAAVPAEINIVERMPVTAVGKIFKPTLRYDAARNVLEGALGEAGIEATITVGADPVHGSAARITLTDAGTRPRAEEILGAYTIHSEIEG